MNHTDCIEKITEYLAGLNQIAKCVRDSLKVCDIESGVDCIFKFYTAHETITSGIIIYKGILSEDEIVKYIATMDAIKREMQRDALTLAKKCECITKKN